MAEVWLDEYIRFYHRKLGKRDNYGDISKQKRIRQELQCKSFDWYIKNVYPDVVIPDELKDPDPNANGTEKVVQNKMKQQKKQTKMLKKKRKSRTAKKPIDNNQNVVDKPLNVEAEIVNDENKN